MLHGLIPEAESPNDWAGADMLKTGPRTDKTLKSGGVGSVSWAQQLSSKKMCENYRIGSIVLGELDSAIAIVGSISQVFLYYVHRRSNADSLIQTPIVQKI